MYRQKICLCIFFIIFMLPIFVFAAVALRPNIIIAPFLQTLTIGPNSSADVVLVVQNNSGVNLTITNVVPQILTPNFVTVNIIENACGLLLPQESCNVLVQLHGLSQLGRGDVNVSVCAFNGTLCSRITKNLRVLNSTLSQIQVFPTTPSIANGTTQQFSAFGYYADNSRQDITQSVTWSSSNPSKAIISNLPNSRGLASGIAAGSSIIAATLNGISGSTKLTVTSATLTSIHITPVNSSVANGNTLRYIAIGIYSDNTVQDLTSSVTWSSSDTTVATITNGPVTKGLATGRSVGPTIITASLGPVSDSTNLNVTSAVLTTISVTPFDSTIPVGEQQQFTATGIFSDNTTLDITNEATWRTDSASIAIVSNTSPSKGLTLARNIGETNVNASLNDINGSTSFTVSAAVLEEVEISPQVATIIDGETQQFTATAIYSDNSTQDVTNNVTWTSSDNNIATISNLGLATGLTVGTITISAVKNSNNKSATGTATLSVTPATLLSITVSPVAQTIPNGTQQQYTATGNFSDSSTRDLTTQVTWTSSLSSVAVISNASDTKGLATATGLGSTTIGAIFLGATGSAALTVSPVTLSSITITPENTAIPRKTQIQYTAIGNYSDASTKNITNEVTWFSSNVFIVRISNARNSKGRATGSQDGSATIIATLNNITGTTPLAVVNVNIGDSFNGGKIGCLKGDRNDLIVANSTNSTSLNWGSFSLTFALSAIDGMANTNKIVSVLGAGTSYAAGLCDAYEIDSAGNSPCVVGNICYNDWFLGATNQMSCLEKNKNQIGGFDSESYWTSREYLFSPYFEAYKQNFTGLFNKHQPLSKVSLIAVRCVRLING